MKAKDTSICKSLHAWLGPRKVAFLGILLTLSTAITILFFNVLHFSEKKAVALGLARRLQYMSAYGYGHQSCGYGFSAAEGGSTTQPNQGQALRDRSCAIFVRFDQAAVRPGAAYLGAALRQYVVRTEIAGARGAATWSRENLVECSSGGTC